jgi:hypothetical protein
MNLSDKEMRILLGIIGSLKHKKVDWQNRGSDYKSSN